MPFVKGGPGGPGRKKSPKTLKKEKVARSASATKAEAKAAEEVARLNAGKTKVKGAAKISPKDLMLEGMREAWAAYKAGGLQVQAIRDRALEMIDDAQHLTPTEGETDPALRARKAEAKEAGNKLLEESVKAMDRVGADLTRAFEFAKAAAPYEHAKLQTSTIQGEMELTVNIKQYGPPKGRPK